MFLKILKWIGITLGFLVVIIACTYVYASVRLNDRQEKTYDVKLPTIEVKHDSATLALGKHLVLIKGCTECHGDNLGGKIIMDDPSMGKIAASNLTRGAGGIPEDYTTKDWVKAIVYGLGKNNKSIIGMPSKEFSQLSKKDLAAIVAYCESLPKVDNELPTSEIGPVIKMVDFSGTINILSAEEVGPDVALKDSVPMKVNAEFGKYLSTMCSGCHRADFHGGEPQLPGLPPSPNLTSTGITGKVSEEQFKNILRTGISHEGRQLNNEEMPWKLTAHYTDDEIQSLYLYFKSLK